jgi:site-specific DNA recombinase
MLPSNAEVLPQTVRCAVYTRKSTEEGLDQQFNSLEAQRDAAQAYVASQQAQGWELLPHVYADGGFTGANMDRPALARLLNDIEAGRIDCVVVYKVDRLSRSLLDFARIMGVFERHSVSFVSVTQQFNTSTPVGRLTLHILLSFAQFEREIISERTRDNKASARRKGKWIGGYVPLGYELERGGGRLLVNDAEAANVRAIFELFIQNRSLTATLEEVNRRGWQTKAWKTQEGKEHAGRAFTEESLARLLSNAIYAGSIRHDGNLYRGEHRAILSERLWKRANRILTTIPKPARKERNKTGALLKGLLQCGGCGKPMAVTYTGKQGRRYRYYVCRSPHDQANENRKRYVSADVIERSVIEQLGLAKRGVKRSADGFTYNGSKPLRSLIEAVIYDGATSEVTIRLRPAKGGRRGRR